LDAAVEALISQMSREPVAQEDLARAKTRLIADAVYAQDNQSMLARWYGAALTTGETVEAVQTWPDRIDAVTAEDVRATSAKWLTRKRCVTAYLMPEENGAPVEAG
jgi:zinc protease